STIQLGSYSYEDNLIRVHRALDQGRVPRYVVEAAGYHQLPPPAGPPGFPQGRRHLPTPGVRPPGPPYPPPPPPPPPSPPPPRPPPPRPRRPSGGPNSVRGGGPPRPDFPGRCAPRRDEPARRQEGLWGRAPPPGGGWFGPGGGEEGGRSEASLGGSRPYPV